MVRLPAPVALAASLLILGLASGSSAQILVAGEGPVVYGHHHLAVSDIDAHKRFWLDTLGGTLIRIPGSNTEAIRFPNVYMLLRAQTPSGGSKGSSVDHIGFSVPNLRQMVDRITANGFRMVTRTEVAATQEVTGDIAVLGPTTSIAFAMGPDDVKVELVENRTQTLPIALHHVHFFGPQNAEMRAWYEKVFGARARPGAGAFLSATLPGVLLNFSPSPAPVAGTRGRVIDHIGFEVDNLEAFTARLAAEGITVDVSYRQVPQTNLFIAFITDPWGTSIELSEGLDQLPLTALSILDLAFVPSGSTPAEALRHTLDLAQHAERWGYRRFWLAEHHNMIGIASAATSLVIGYVAGGTQTIRVGAGGIMLPNHAPLVIAEQFGTLEALYPGRIDLGLGRAPGTDPLTLRALRRDPTSASTFPQDVVELQAFLGPLQPGQRVQAVPGTGSNVPIWILGSSVFGAQLAAALSLPYAFASHFAPDELFHALQIYRDRFQPSAQLERPYVMVGANVIAAETDAEARRLFTSVQQGFTNLLRGTRGPMAPPIDDIETYWTPLEKAQAERMLACSFVGSAQTVRDGLAGFIERTGADEVIVAAGIFDHAARLRSYELLAGLPL